MLVCWLKNDETHSWDEIRKALRNIEEIKLAEEIQAGVRSITHVMYEPTQPSSYFI